jgi:MFS transporter, ACS family, tartrate transporter
MALTVAFAGQLTCLPIVNSLPGSFLRGPAAAGGIALYNMIGQFGGFTGPYIIGAVKGQTGSYAPAMAVLCSILLVAAILAFALRRTVPRSGEGAAWIGVDHDLCNGKLQRRVT